MRWIVVLTTGWVWSEEAVMACGSGTNYYVERKDGAWVVVDRSSWMA